MFQVVKQRMQLGRYKYVGAKRCGGFDEKPLALSKRENVTNFCSTTSVRRLFAQRAAARRALGFVSVHAHDAGHERAVREHPGGLQRVHEAIPGHPNFEACRRACHGMSQTWQLFV